MRSKDDYSSRISLKSRLSLRTTASREGYSPPPTIREVSENLTFATGHIYVKHSARKKTRQVLESSLSQLEVVQQKTPLGIAKSNKLRGKKTNVKVSAKKGKSKWQNQNGNNSIKTTANDGFIDQLEDQKRHGTMSIEDCASKTYPSIGRVSLQHGDEWAGHYSAPAHVPAPPDSARSSTKRRNTKCFSPRHFRNPHRADCQRTPRTPRPCSRSRSRSRSHSHSASMGGSASVGGYTGVANSFTLSHEKRLNLHAVERWGTWAQRVQDMVLFDLQKERRKVLRLGFQEKVQWIDFLIREERNAMQMERKDNLVADLQTRLALLKKGYEVKLEVLERQLQKEKQVFDDLVELEFQQMEARHAQKYEDLVVKAVSKAVATCSCEKDYLCKHNSSFPLKDFRPSPSVMQLRRNALRLRREGFMEDAEFDEHAADRMEHKERQKYVEDLKNKVAGSKEGAYPVPTSQLDRLVAQHEKELRHWRTDVEIRTKKLANEHSGKRMKLHVMCNKESNSILKQSRIVASDVGLETQLVREVMETPVPENTSSIKKMIMKSRSMTIASLEPSNLDALSQSVLQPVDHSQPDNQRGRSPRTKRAIQRASSPNQAPSSLPHSPIRPQSPPTKGRPGTNPRRPASAGPLQNHAVTAWSVPGSDVLSRAETRPGLGSEASLRRYGSGSSSVTELEMYRTSKDFSFPKSTLEKTGEIAFGIPSETDVKRYQCQMHAKFLCLHWTVRAKKSFQLLLASELVCGRFKEFCTEQEAQGIFDFYMESSGLQPTKEFKKIIDQNRIAVDLAAKYWGKVKQTGSLIQFLLGKRQEAFTHLYRVLFPAFLSSPDTLLYIENILEEKNEEGLLQTSWLQAFQSVSAEIPWGAAIGDAATPQYRMLFCNHMLEKQLDLDEEELLGNPICSLFQGLSTSKSKEEADLAQPVGEVLKKEGAALVQTVSEVLKNHRSLYLRCTLGGGSQQDPTEVLVLLAPVWNAMKVPSYYLFMQVPFSSFRNEMELLSLCEIINLLPLKVDCRSSMKNKHFSRFKEAIKSGSVVH